MTKKHYSLIASALRELKPLQESDEYPQWRQTVMSLASKLEADNPRFNRSTFIIACGV